MPISGVVVRCLPERAKELSQAISAPGEVEVHGVLPDGKLVAVIESSSVDGEMAIVRRLLAIRGVVAVQLAYHNFEDIVEGSFADIVTAKGEA